MRAYSRDQLEDKKEEVEKTVQKDFVPFYCFHQDKRKDAEQLHVDVLYSQPALWTSVSFLRKDSTKS